MPQTIQVRNRQVIFPPVCVVCAAAAQGTYPVERTFTYGRQGILITQPAPMCALHLAQAKGKSPRERAGERAGLIVGILAGLGTAGALLAYWSAGRQGGWLLNLILACVLGVGIFLIIWIGGQMWLTPRLASPGAKAVRTSLRLTRYWPQEDLLEMTFENEAIAHLVLRANSPQPEGIPAQNYTIEAVLVCADIRLTTLVETTVKMDHLPSALEGETLLWPVAEQEVSASGGQGCPFVLTDLEVYPIE